MPAAADAQFATGVLDMLVYGLGGAAQFERDFLRLKTVAHTAQTGRLHRRQALGDVHRCRRLGHLSRQPPEPSSLNRLAPTAERRRRCLLFGRPWFTRLPPDNAVNPPSAQRLSLPRSVFSATRRRLRRQLVGGGPFAAAPGVISANDSAWETGGRASAFCNPSSTTWRMAMIRSPAFLQVYLVKLHRHRAAPCS